MQKTLRCRSVTQSRTRHVLPCIREVPIMTLQADDMCSLPAAGYDFDPPHLHSAIMTDLVCQSPQQSLISVLPKLDGQCGKLLNT